MTLSHDNAQKNMRLKLTSSTPAAEKVVTAYFYSFLELSWCCGGEIISCKMTDAGNCEEL